MSRLTALTAAPPSGRSNSTFQTPLAARPPCNSERIAPSFSGRLQKAEVSCRWGLAASANVSASGSSSIYPTPQALDAALTQRLDTESVQEVELSVQGVLPAWLNGMYLKNGPGTFRSMAHLFDGYGQITRTRFENGRAFFSSRFVETEAWKAFRDTGKMRFREFGTSVPALQNSFNTAALLLGLGQGVTDNSSVNVVLPWAPGELLAVTETPVGSYRVAVDSLQTLGRLGYQDEVKGDFTTAHGKVVGKYLINMVSGIGGNYTVYRQELGSQTRQVVAKIPLSYGLAPSWVHDFPCTRNYMVVPETPVQFNLAALMGGSAPYVVFDWNPQLGTRLHVVRLSDGKVTTVRAPPFFTFHYVNAFESEDGRHLSFDFGWYEDPSMLNNLLLDNMREERLDVRDAPLRRMTVAVDGSESVAVTDLTTDPSCYVQCELPAVNPQYKMLPYRFAYGLAAVRPTTFGNALAKWDVQHGNTLLWHEPGCIPAEPLFIPSPNPGAVEDEGVVLCYVIGADGIPFLLALDGCSFSEIARLRGMRALPYQFHGAWLADGN